MVDVHQGGMLAKVDFCRLHPAKPREMLKDVLLVIIGLIGGLFIQQSAEQLFASAPLWISVPLSVGGVGGFTLLFVSGAQWLMNGQTPLPADNVEDDD